MNTGRIFVIATNVFREVIRDRVLYLIGLFSIVLAIAMRLLPEISAGVEGKISLDLGLAAMSLLGLVIAVFVGTGLINKEIEKRTVLVLVAKPISRVEFIVGKHLGLVAVLAVLIGAMTAIFMGLLAFNQITFPAASLALAAFYLFLQLSLVTAIALCFGVFTSSLLATLLTFGVYLMGNFSRDLVSLGNLSKNPTIIGITRGAYLALPDLVRLDLKNQAVYGILPSPLSLLGDAVYGLFYTAFLLAIAILIFSRREF